MYLPALCVFYASRPCSKALCTKKDPRHEGRGCSSEEGTQLRQQEIEVWLRGMKDVGGVDRSLRPRGRIISEQHRLIDERQIVHVRLIQRLRRVMVERAEHRNREHQGIGHGSGGRPGAGWNFVRRGQDDGVVSRDGFDRVGRRRKSCDALRRVLQTVALPDASYRGWRRFETEADQLGGGTRAPQHRLFRCKDEDRVLDVLRDAVSADHRHG